MPTMYPLYALSSLLLLGFTSDFRFYDYYYNSCLHPALPLVFYSISLLFLSYHEYFLLEIACYISSCFCMLVLTIQFSMHVYDSDLSIHVCLSMHATWHSHHHSLGSSDSPGSSCPGLGAWCVWILPVAD